MASTKQPLRSTIGQDGTAAYIVARERGRTADEAAKDAALRMAGTPDGKIEASLAAAQ